MTADCLIDTNVLVYAVDASPENAAKKEAAIALIQSTEFGLSAQVLQKFFVTVTRKLQAPLLPEEAMEFLDRFDAFPLAACRTCEWFIGMIVQKIPDSGFNRSNSINVALWKANSRFWGAFGRRFLAMGRIMR